MNCNKCHKETLCLVHNVCESCYNICNEFPITNQEYQILDKKYGKLANFASWKLIKNNQKNNHTDEFDDINQELLISIFRAGSYYKRQVYIEQCVVKSLEFVGAAEYLKILAFDSKAYKGLGDEAKKSLKTVIPQPKGFLALVLWELAMLWHNRTRHGAGRQKFGFLQEGLSCQITNTVVPTEESPDRFAQLRFDAKFDTYCKSICWNSQKAMGKKITKERVIRAGSISLSEYSEIY